MQGEHLVERFYTHFKVKYSNFLSHIQGISVQEQREEYASFLLNRLMFLYFMQKKGLLNGDLNYLQNRLHMIQLHYGADRFYRKFLRPLFLEGLSTSTRTVELEALLGNVPYLHQSLFCGHKTELNYPTLQISDQAFIELFIFFESYEWHLDKRSHLNT